MTRAVVAKPTARPDMPAQPKQLGTAFRAEVWPVHSEDSAGKNSRLRRRK